MTATHDRDQSDGEAVRQAAREIIGLHGGNALAVLAERAEMAAAIDDLHSARAWWDIYEAAEKLLDQARRCAA